MKNLRHRVTYVIKYVMHVHAILALIGGVYRSTRPDITPEYAAAIMAQYVLYAIFFELIALNVQLGRLIDYYAKNKKEEKDERDKANGKTKKNRNGSSGTEASTDASSEKKA